MWWWLPFGKDKLWRLWKMKWIKTIIAIIGIVSLILFMNFLVYGFSDDGRLKRDYGMQSSGISDNEVKGIWCELQGFPKGYNEINEKKYCGDIEVNMTCKFTNKGDYCQINKK
jgi:hypothetical protein